MKVYTYLLLVTALFFGMTVQNVKANTIHSNTAEIIASGNAGAYYDVATQTLTLRMLVSEGQDRVMVVLSGRDGSAVYKDKKIVDTRGAIVEISMEDMPSGIYYLRVKGSQIAYATRLKHK